MSVFYALQTRDGRFWDCWYPYELQSLNKKRCKQWEPHFCAAPKRWAREATAQTKLRDYQLIRVMRPDLPEMFIGKFEDAPQLIDTISRDLTPVERVGARIMFTHGRSMANDFLTTVKAITPGLQYAMSVCKPKKEFRTHIPTAYIGKNYVFGTDEDLVMLKMLGALRKHYDITSFHDC